MLLESDDINAAPVVSSIENQEVPEDGILTGVTFTVSDDYTSSEALVRATSAISSLAKFWNPCVA